MTELVTKLIKVNNFTRPGYKLSKVRGLVLHYTANPGASAQNHFTFFNNGGGGRYAGAQIFVDRKEALLIVPLNEVCYHANEGTCRVDKLKETRVIGGKVRYWHANLNTIGIEMCLEKDGTIHPETIARTARVVAELMKKFGLTVNDLYRHYDITRKSCPAPWVKAPVEWTRFKDQVIKISAPATKPVTPKPAVAPVVTPVTSTSQTGFVSVLKEELNVRVSASFEAKAVKVVKPGSFHKVYESKNGMYRIGKDQWISASTKYVKFFKEGDQIGVATIKSWTPSTDTLNVRASASSTAKVVSKLKQKTSWKVYDFTEDFVRVGKDQWITRNDKYVTLKFGL